ncbi:MFS transporter [Rothia sp. AR01]|uniref:Putative proline/betaine transporter n=1 Tax=Rothia santali TaxID=2949643 RepID=A0A9X2HLT6_9MICC|nr:MFS transporter [Rothia santali]MCP3427278.1 MFS transporter [Rothia santali]
MSTVTPAPTPAQLTAARKAVVSSSIGNALEWFDIIVYASFAVIIQKNFFPSDDPTVGLIITFAGFAVSYLIRPLGALVLGSYADRNGRKKGLTLTIFLMLVGTTLMAIAPTTAVIGIAATFIILLSRLIQGFSAGGEFGTATTFLVETAPHRKAFYASWQVTSQGISMFLASVFGFVLFTYLTEDQLDSWGWRIPFFFGMLIGPVGWYIRSKLEETSEFTQMKREGSPLKAAFTTHLGRILAATACVGVGTISVYLILYMPTFAVQTLHIPATAGYLGGIVAGVVTMVGVPFIGMLADRIGPARIMTYGAIAALVLAWPLFALIIAVPTVPVFAFVVAVLGVIMAIYFGPLPALMTAIFPAEVRGSGLSIAYNAGVTLMGGFAPLVLTWIGTLYAPGIYYMVIAVISLVGLGFARRKYAMR